MKRIKWVGVLAAILVQTTVSASIFSAIFPQHEHTLGGAPVQADRNIVENLSNSNEHSTLLELLKASDLLDTLKGEGPYTIFAPTNAAFDRLPTDMVEEMLKPERKSTAVKVIGYQIVEGKFDASAMTKLMRENKEGIAQLTTLEGNVLRVAVSRGGHDLELTDDKGVTAKLLLVDGAVSNGIIHVTDRVMQP